MGTGNGKTRKTRSVGTYWLEEKSGLCPNCRVNAFPGVNDSLVNEDRPAEGAVLTELLQLARDHPHFMLSLFFALLIAIWLVIDLGLAMNSMDDT